MHVDKHAIIITQTTVHGQLWHVTGGRLSRLGQTEAELQSYPSPTRCSEMALRHSLTLAVEGHTCHI